MSSSDNRIILVTGANKGIGFEAVRLLSERLPSATILMGTRALSNGEAAITKLKESSPSSPFLYTNIQPTVLDVTDKQSLALAVDEVKSKYGHLDVLINNSGISNVGGESVHKGVLGVNLYGVRDCIEAFLPILSPHATVITVSSEVGAWTTYRLGPKLQQQLLDPSSLTWPTIDRLAQSYSSPPSLWPSSDQTYGAYGVSKALVSAYMRLFALQHPELKVAVVCPGYCATDLNRHSGFRTAAQGGESVIWPVLNDFQSGKFYQDGKEYPWCAPRPKDHGK